MELRKEIEQGIREEIGRFVESHPNITFRFEYSELRRRFLVSYHFSIAIDKNDPIWDDVYELEDYFYQKYNDKAPLFSEDDRFFLLSPSAEKIKATQPRKPVPVRVAVASPSILSKTVRLNK